MPQVERGQIEFGNMARQASAGLERVGQGLVGAYPARAVIAVRRVSNGWLVDDGRGVEVVALTAGDAAAAVARLLAEVEHREALLRSEQ